MLIGRSVLQSTRVSFYKCEKDKDFNQFSHYLRCPEWHSQFTYLPWTSTTGESGACGGETILETLLMELACTWSVVRPFLSISGILKSDLGLLWLALMLLIVGDDVACDSMSILGAGDSCNTACAFVACALACTNYDYVMQTLGTAYLAYGHL